MTKDVDVVIVGAGLTGLTMAFYLTKYGAKVAVLEKENKCGGVINTVRKDGFIYEVGPNTGSIGSPELVELFDDLQDKMKVEVANPKAKYRWIWKHGKWRALPSGLLSAINTPLFTLKDKFRILGEPFRKPGTDRNETIADLVRRRLGKSFLDYAVDPFISGIYSGDAEKLITRFAMPKLYNLEQNYGSFIRGAIKKSKESKTAIEKRVSKEVFSVEGGLSNFAKALEESIGKESIFTACNNIQIDKNGDKYTAKYTDAKGESQEVNSKLVVSTIGSYGVKNLFSFLSESERKAVTDLEYAKIVQVLICYKNWQGKHLNAFGGLMPSKEKRNSLGFLFTSSLFKNRAPEGGAVISIFMGGTKNPGMIEKTNEEIEAVALKEIEETLGMKKKPDIMQIAKYQRAIAQYDIRSEKRLEAIVNVQNKYPGLYIAGNLRDGVGMSDRVKQARNIAEEIKNKI